MSINIEEIKEVIQSCNLNFLLGAGTSQPYLPLLNNIEVRLDKEKDIKKRIEIYKEYFQNVMLPNLEVINGTVDRSDGSDFNTTYSGYKKIFELISLILLKRKTTILSKQANVFTTNVDIIIERVLEDCNLTYNDGFSGQIKPVFNLSNFKNSIFKRSLHFENISEIPLFNLIKIHGSLTWRKCDDEIVFSKLEHFDDSLLSEEGNNFLEKYKEILIVNPESEKLEKTLIDLQYYELLRMYSSELEKENSVLFVMGFSMADQHIREITIRSANSNPTLKIYIFCHSNKSLMSMKDSMSYEKLKYSNIEILSPKDDAPENQYNLEVINNTIFEEVVNKIGNNDDHI